MRVPKGNPGRLPCSRRIVATVGLAELCAQVASRYRRLGLPAWPDPHAGLESPREEEYSRVTDPERYRVVHARARVWTDVLREVSGVEVESLARDALDGNGSRFDRGVRLDSTRPGTLPLFLLEQNVPLLGQEESLAVLHISVARPEVVVEMQPDCGCDACDSGSDDLLTAIDETVGHVLGGPFVALRGDGWHADWYPDGGASGGAGRGPDHAMLMDLCRRLAGGEKVRLPARADAFVGRSWLT